MKRQNPATDSGPEAPRRPNYDPDLPPRQVLQPAAARVLDPRTATCVSGVEPRSTAYVGNQLMVSMLNDRDDLLGKLRAAAAELGWQVNSEHEHPESPENPDNSENAENSENSAHDEREGEQPSPRRGPDGRREAFCRYDDEPLGVSCVSIATQERRASRPPDAWTLLQQARGKYGAEELRGVSLDHVLNVTPLQATPWHRGNPVEAAPWHRGNPVEPVPWHRGNPSGAEPGYALASYAQAGSGGRQPMSFVGPAPYRRKNKDIRGRRPVVALLDTGCGEHPWLDGVVDREVRLDGHPIGDTSAITDPEVYPDQEGPRDGGLDTHAGHGTFVAGLVRQACPDADILSWRVISSSGVILESAWIRALSQIAELARRHAAGEPGGHPIDVLNLSVGYYHETPDDELFDPTLHKILSVLARSGTAVVCSAGNDATSRQFYPAAFAPHPGATATTTPTDVPIVSVGALNPNATSVAMFSNTGPWVRCYEVGASVMSTVPTMQGGLEPYARIDLAQLDDSESGVANAPRQDRRGKPAAASTASSEHGSGRFQESATIDPDDYTGGFALWSGTSFAAPVIAGKIAQELVGKLPDKEKSPAEAVRRCAKAVKTVSGVVATSTAGSGRA